MLTRSEENWISLWSPHGASYNCSTSTFDVGYLESGSTNVFIAASPQAPYVIREFFPSTDLCTKPKNATSTRNRVRSFWGGAWIDALHLICTELSFRCKIYESVDNTDSVGGSPVLRDVLNGQAAFGVSPLLITQSRYDSNNYSVVRSPMKKTYAMLINQDLLGMETKGTDQILMNIFGPQIWSFIALTIGTLLVLMVFSQRTNHITFKLPPYERIIWESIYGIITSDFAPRLVELKFHSPKSTTLLVSLVLGFSVVIQNLFSAMIPVQLATSQQLAPPFRTASGFLKTNFKIYGTAAIVEAMTMSKSPISKEIGNRAIPFQDNVNDYYAFIAGNDEEHVTYLVSAEGYWMLANFSCDFIEVVAKVETAPLGAFWFRRNDVKKMEFETRFNRLTYTGVIEFSVKRYEQTLRNAMFKQGKPTTCLAHPYPRELQVGQHGLTFSEFTFVFLIVLIVSAIAWIVLLLEILMGRTGCFGLLGPGRKARNQVATL